METRPLFFLLKCFACIGFVLFVLGWPGVETAPGAAQTQTRASVAKPTRRPQLEERARDLAQAGADALVAAARDKCLSAPRDCAALLQNYQGGGRAH